MKMDYARIRELIPVRNPMIQVDKVVEFVPGERIETVKVVSGADPCYADMAEGTPAERFNFPRSMVIESFGQSSALLWLGTVFADRDVIDAVLMAGRIRKVRFHGHAYPGDVIRHTVRLEGVVDGVTAFFSGESHVDDRLIFSAGSMSAVLRPHSDLSERGVFG